ncbi:hypothetical protein CYMTET_41690 [Cymbomonas tetramitiformis]|uniref:FAD/NAD(P)-binding domain-containing protein n=1 Tax=Cymbomonas tetramitiformis TaxID=36881 RepID=A0AAE0C5K6_9CHLO|nr:hypothetical protein CYMTET_41690 [Cymbomonas tetramitiformis]|eukprot:gene3216-4060_t
MRVCVLGSGPIGIDFAVNAVARGFHVTLLERGASIAQNVCDWQHVQLFSPWHMNVSKQGKQVLEGMGRDITVFDSETVYPSGKELVDTYLHPLAEYLRKSGHCDVQTSTEAIAIGRGHFLKGQAIGSKRKGTPFTVQYKFLHDGSYGKLVADVVVDATGTYGNGNWLGAGGIPALGEQDVTMKITRDIPNVLELRNRFLGHSTAVVGSGASAITTLNALKDLASQNGEATVEVHWITRHGDSPYKRVENDPLPQRDRLAVLGNELAKGDSAGCPSNFKLTYHGHQHLHSIRQVDPNTLEMDLESDPVEGDAKYSKIQAHNVVANVGYRPCTDLHRELQVHQCYATEGPMKLAAALMAASGDASGDCLQQVAPGAQTMLNPEPDFFVIGMKAYGRSSAFLMRIGFEQVASVMELIDAP